MLFPCRNIHSVDKKGELCVRDVFKYIYGKEEKRNSIHLLKELDSNDNSEGNDPKRLASRMSIRS